ncbi:permease-like cell division protein FtsX [Maledivibacter halophilus]|uniref:Cell division protein FtsX n=1 Tax=Maledivibacter halophilus TaxID=36842 RepID=A0A1T5JHY5_9FIRM|nr:permease-like cell division protein FtsX [Maledivibacter halophilus]SKC50994.1 cell division protein FtsX [Maledivibacter halophilus]
MKIRTWGYMIKEGFKNLWRNRMMSLASVGSVTATLMILGMIFILIFNINSMAKGAQEQVNSIQVYLMKGISAERIEEIGDEINKIQGLKSVEFHSKQQALDRMKGLFGENKGLLEGLEDNPLPNSYIVYVNNIEESERVVGEIEAISDIESVKFHKDIVGKLINITNFVKIIGLAVIVILIAISIFIIGNTIKLTVAARRREISIMKYVGATNRFIRWPFFIEGTFLGLIGGAIALLIVFFAYKYLYGIAAKNFFVILTAYLVPAQYVLDNLLLIFIVLGAGIGALGSITSMKKYLKV